MRPTLDGVLARSSIFAEWWGLLDRNDGCWEWTARHDRDGYGLVWVCGFQWRIHRLVYRLFVGPLDPSLTIDHLCRNTRCANPAHLEQVTSRVNIMRGNTRARFFAERTHCSSGHPFTSENTYWRTHRGESRPYRLCRTCALAKSIAGLKKHQPRLTAAKRERYRTDPEFRERTKATSLASYHKRKRETTLAVTP